MGKKQKKKSLIELTIKWLFALAALISAVAQLAEALK